MNASHDRMVFASFKRYPLSEHDETPRSDASQDEELDDLFLSPEDSEGEIVAQVDASGDVQDAEAAEQAGDDSQSNGESQESATPGEAVPIGQMGGGIPPAGEEAQGGDAPSSGELDATNDRIKVLEEERDDVKNRMMRVAADLENFRKRAAREREDMRKYGIDKVVLELLPVVDNLERALQHAEKNAEDNSITEGVRMVYRQFLTALEKHGVKGFESKGEMFDPQKHEAIQQVESEEHETGTVLEQYQKGYFLHDRLIRPAMVSVAKQTTTPTVVDSAEDVVEPAIESAGEPADETAETEAPVVEEVGQPDEVLSEDSDSDSDDAAGEDANESLEESTDVGM